MSGEHLPPRQPVEVTIKGSNGMATAGFILGLLGLLGSWIPLLNVFAAILGLVGVILAAIGLSKSKKVNAGKGLAIAGIVLGMLAILFTFLVNTAFVSSVDKAVDDATKTTIKNPGSTSSEPANNEAGTTREHPVPLGTALSSGGWTVTVKAVKTVTHDKYDQYPKAGNVLLQVSLTATYNGDDKQGDSAWANVKYVTPSGNTIDSTDGMFIPENQFDSLKTVYHGATITGDEILEVPAANWQDGVLAVSPDAFKDDVFIALK